MHLFVRVGSRSVGVSRCGRQFTTSTGLHSHSHGKPPRNIGIVAMETYFPRQYVAQSDLEKWDGVSEGKYQLGLGQEGMAFCGDREDMNSIALTAVANLLEKNSIRPQDIGRLEVGTETVLDKSKSVKSVLMQLFEGSGNDNIEGIDTTNACYGGTNALFNSLNWMESSYWDGRYALAIAGDIAVYEKGPARPTGGAGVVAMLIGPNAPLVFEQGVRGSYMENAWDFYKPRLSSEYPVVDGKLSNDCYLRAVDKCFQRYSAAFHKANKQTFDLNRDFDYCIFHSPYSKLVQKSWARLHYLNVLSHPAVDSKLRPFSLIPTTETYNHKEIAQIALDESRGSYAIKVIPSLVIPKNIGNSYCGSLYAGLQGLIDTTPISEGSRIGLFSYGSGLAASLFSARVAGDITTLRKGVTERLNDRIRETPEYFENTLTLREMTHNSAPYLPVGDLTHLFPGTYYLSEVDSLYRRKYLRLPK